MFGRCSEEVRKRFGTRLLNVLHFVCWSPNRMVVSRSSYAAALTVRRPASDPSTRARGLIHPAPDPLVPIMARRLHNVPKAWFRDRTADTALQHVEQDTRDEERAMLNRTAELLRNPNRRVRIVRRAGEQA